MASPQFKDDKMGAPPHIDHSQSPTRDSHEIVNVQGGDLLNLESVDPVLNAKMKLVNDAIDEIGFTGYQAKLFVLNGFGYVIHSVSSEVRSHGRKGEDGNAQCFTIRRRTLVYTAVSQS
jgi:hypothetical protein